jgi:hypothetical protein
MRTTIRLSDDILRKAKKKAAEDGRTLTSLVEEGLRVVLAEPKPGGRAKITLPIFSPAGGTLPGVDLNCNTDLEDIMDGR